MPEPEAVGMSTERLKRIDRFLEDRYVAPGKFAGTLIEVARKGETVHRGLLGFADRERQKPMQEDTLFRIYSMTKPITSVAFMMLVEDGLVALDDPVSRFIPSWRELGVFVAGTRGAYQTRPTDAPMRIVDLLRHTSGLTYDFQFRSNVDAAYRETKLGMRDCDTDLEGMVEELAGLPLEFQPGSAWNYSVSTDVLGYLIGKISGMPFERFVQTRILEPLGMRDTHFYVPPEKHDRLAACYALGPDAATILQDDPVTSPYRAPSRFISGGGGLVSTAADYMRFCRMLLGRGASNKTRLLGPKTVELMTLNHLPEGRELVAMSRSLFSEASYAGLGFGLGFAVTLDVARTLTAGSVGSYFWGGAASTFFWIDPREELIVVFMTQFLPSSHYPVRRDLRTLVYQAITETNG